jgi:hypothetical protein
MERRLGDDYVKTDAEGTGFSIDNIGDGSSEIRQVSLFFLDPDDALSIHGEMLQLEQLKDQVRQRKKQ